MFEQQAKSDLVVELPVATPIDLPKSERDACLLALAVLATQRPGWYAYLREIAEKYLGQYNVVGPDFDFYYQNHGIEAPCPTCRCKVMMNRAGLFCSNPDCDYHDVS
jgi:hypothetical protein